jgi:hypothetical protein
LRVDPDELITFKKGARVAALRALDQENHQERDEVVPGFIGSW